MSDLLIAVLPGVATGILSLIGVYASNRKSQAVTDIKIDNLTETVKRHNNVIERTYALEGRMTEAEHDIRDLKGKVL